MKFEIREIDAWMDCDGWTWNSSYHIGEFTTNAKNEKRAFTNALARIAGIRFKLNRTIIYDDGDIIEIQDRKTHEPLFAAIPIYS